LVSKSQIKLITSLHKKKFRNKEGLFIAEGPKVISELIDAGLEIHSHFSTLIPENPYKIFFHITEGELKKISTLKTANTAVAIFKIPEQNASSSEGLILVMDAIQDPGNLGTIIRLSDWFGVAQLVCSLDTVDCYNSKVVQATMGSIARVNIKYCDLSEYLINASLPIYGGVLNGENIYTSETPKKAILVLGNEGNGISDQIMALISNKITIPQFGASQKTESLNVATATAILLSEFNR
jgi:TrmH family RNA methyltransferase